MSQAVCHDKKYPLLVAFGNPILDITCRIKTNEIHHKYDLKWDHQYEKPSKLIQQIKNDALQENGGESSTNPGGSSLNTLRILDKLLPTDQRLMYCGAIGKDENGEKLTALLKKTNIELKLEIVPEYPTSNCLCLIWNDNACLLADISAALHYKLEHIQKSNLKQYLINTKIIYVEGYFIPNRYSVCEYLLKEIIQKNDIMLIMNLNATYICKDFQKECKTLAENAGAVFGNADQYLELGKAYELTDLQSVAQKLLNAYSILTNKKCTNINNKLVVVTDGPRPIQLFYIRNDEMCHDTFIVPEIVKSNIVDTTGAGDAFVAGFLTAFLKGSTPLECAKFGTYVAADSIKNVGVHLSPDFVGHY